MKAVHNEDRAATLAGSELTILPDGTIWRVAEMRNRRLVPLRERRLVGHRMPDGYLRLSVTVDGESFNVLAHRLVWRVFYGPIPDGKEVNHRNGNKADNSPSNLELVSPSGNVRHSLDVLGRQRAKGERHGNRKLTAEIVREIRMRCAGGSAKEYVAGLFGIAPSTVYRIVNRTAWSHVQ